MEGCPCNSLGQRSRNLEITQDGTIVMELSLHSPFVPTYFNLTLVDIDGM